MKRLSLFLLITIIASVATWALKAQNKPAPKTYHISLTLDQWNSVFNGLETIKNAVKVSNMPAVQSTFISDSIITVYQNEFSRQLNQQIAAEQKAKPEVKKDSTKPKK